MSNAADKHTEILLNKACLLPTRSSFAVAPFLGGCSLIEPLSQGLLFLLIIIPVQRSPVSGLRLGNGRGLGGRRCKAQEEDDGEGA